MFAQIKLHVVHITFHIYAQLTSTFLIFFRSSLKQKVFMFHFSLCSFHAILREHNFNYRVMFGFSALQVMVMNVTSLLKTVKAVEDEHTRGTRAMEATIEAISQEIRSLQYSETNRSSVMPSTPEDLMRVTKNVTVATAKAVAAGASNSQADITAAANIGRRAISEMLIVCKSVAWNCAESTELRQRTLEAGAAVATAYRDLLESVLRGCTADERMLLSRRVAKCVTDLVGMAQLLKGSDWVDPEDPTVIAENELLGAAASIDAAAKKLASLRPRRQPDIKV